MACGTMPAHSDMQHDTAARHASRNNTTAPGTSFLAMAAAWQQQINELNGGGQQSLRRIATSRVRRGTSTTSDDNASDSDGYNASGMQQSPEALSEAGSDAASPPDDISEVLGTSSGMVTMRSMEQTPATAHADQLRAPAMVHPADAAAVEAALTSGLFLETRQPPWRGAGRQAVSVLTILVNSAAPLAADEQSLAVYHAGLGMYASPSDSGDSRRPDDGDGDGVETARAALYASIKVCSTF